MGTFSIFVCQIFALLQVLVWTQAGFANPERPRTTSTQNECARLLRAGDFANVRRVLEADRLDAESAIKSILRAADPSEAQALKKHWSAIYYGDIISTPLETAVHISEKVGFKSGQTLIDIGSGHGNPDFVFGALNPGLTLIGYDIVKAKVEAANSSAKKLGLDNVSFIQQDLSDPEFVLPEADYYYFFNPVNEDLLSSIAKQIYKYAQHRDIKVLVYAGGWAADVFERHDFFSDPRVRSHDLQIFTITPPKSTQVLDISKLKHFRTAKLLETYKVFLKEQKYAASSRQRDQYQAALFEAISVRPAEERRHYFVRVLNNRELNYDNALLDALAGLRIDQLDKQLKKELVINTGIKKYVGEEIWYAPRAGQQTSWRDLLTVVESRMQLSKSNYSSVADLGSGVGRLGILIGLLYPHVEFTGIEIVDERVQNANRAAQELGLQNVRFIAANLADPKVELPLVEHFYMFNPTNSKTSDIITDKFLELSKRIRFQVHLLTVFQSTKFYRYFSPQEGRMNSYSFSRNQTPAP